MRLPPGPSVHRDRLLDAMAFLLVDLHRNGVYWGDCSLANTLFRRDGDRIQAYLVDAETSEVHPSLSDGQRAYDAEILVENVAFGLADLAAMQDAPDPRRGDRRRGARPRPLPGGLGGAPRRADPAGRRPPGDPGPRPAAERPGLLRRRRPRPDRRHRRVRLRMSVTTRRFHARELERRTTDPGARGPGPAAAQRPQRVLAPGSSGTRGRPVPPERGGRALAARRLPADARPDRRRRRAGARPRPGVLRRARAEVVPVRGGRPRRRARPGDRGLRRRSGRPRRRRPRTASASGSVALDLERLGEEDHDPDRCRSARRRRLDVRCRPSDCRSVASVAPSRR